METIMNTEFSIKWRRAPKGKEGPLGLTKLQGLNSAVFVQRVLRIHMHLSGPLGPNLSQNETEGMHHLMRQPERSHGFRLGLEALEDALLKHNLIHPPRTKRPSLLQAWSLTGPERPSWILRPLLVFPDLYIP